MAVRRPLVRVAGRIRPLPAGDTLQLSAGPSFIDRVRAGLFRVSTLYDEPVIGAAAVHITREGVGASRSTAQKHWGIMVSSSSGSGTGTLVDAASSPNAINLTTGSTSSGFTALKVHPGFLVTSEAAQRLDQGASVGNLQYPSRIKRAFGQANFSLGVMNTVAQQYGFAVVFGDDTLDPDLVFINQTPHWGAFAVGVVYGSNWDGSGSRYVIVYRRANGSRGQVNTSFRPIPITELTSATVYYTMERDESGAATVQFYAHVEGYGSTLVNIATITDSSFNATTEQRGVTPLRNYVGIRKVAGTTARTVDVSQLINAVEFSENTLVA